MVDASAHDTASVGQDGGRYETISRPAMLRFDDLSIRLADLRAVYHNTRSYAYE